MRHITWSVCAIGVAAVLAACGTTTQFTQTNPSPVPMRPRDPSTVQVFTASKPQRPFVEVGIIEAQQSSRLSTDGMGAIIAALRKEAARRGCDGVIIVSNDNSVVGSSGEEGGSTGTLKGYRGACIMYRQQSAARPAAAGPPAAGPPGAQK